MQQQQLSNLMLNTWPMFRKCSIELRAAVASCKYIVHPYTKPGQRPTASAMEKADLVQRAMESFRPSRFADEEGFGGMVFDLTEAILNGISVCELLWDQDALDNDGRPEAIVRASAWIHPRHLVFRPDGSVAILKNSNPLAFPSQVQSLGTMEAADNPSKFLVAKYKSKSGSFLGAGLMRTLAWYWIMVVYGRDYALTYAQKFGTNFFDIAYKAGSNNKEDLDLFEAIAKRAANSNYAVHPDSSVIQITPPSPMGSDNAQMAIMELADRQCQMLLLGQTLTSSTPNRSGSRAQGEVHENVRSERLEEIARWISRSILTEQFAESLLIENYGEATERPTVEPDMTRPLDAQEQANYIQTISNSRIPVNPDELYKRIGYSKPDVGEIVVSSGAFTILEEPLTESEKRERDFNTQLGQQVEIAKAQGELNTKATAHQILDTLKGASKEDLATLDQLATAAERAPHRNGELKAVEHKLAEISRTKL